MPKDPKGNFHLNNGRMHAAMTAKPMERPKSGIMSSPETAKPSGGPNMEGGNPGGSSTTLHDHGDGTFHTEGHDGMKEEHPSIGHALMHMAGKHSEGMHHHVHSDGMGGSMTSHHHDGMGVQGPHEHGSSDEAADHMKQVMDGGGEGEGGKDQYDGDWGEQSHSLAGM